MRFAILLFAALPLLATTVTLERDGVAVSGEVCRFRAGERVNPFGRWLSSQELTCVAAGADLALPEGLWNVFGRAAGGIADPVLVDGGHAPSTLTLKLTPAAMLVATVGEGQAAVAYAPRRAVAYPVIGRTFVPAGEELWLFVLEKTRPVSIVPVPAIEAGLDRVVDARGSGLQGVLGWLELPDDDRRAVARATGTAPPLVRGRSGATAPAVDADPLPALTLLHGAFVLVRGLEAGDAQLELGGRGWLLSRRPVQIRASSVTVAAAPLVVRGAASLIVNWSGESGLAELEQAIGSCTADDARSPQFQVTVSACANGCTPVRRELFDATPEFGSFSLDDLVPGPYRIDVQFGKLPPVSREVTVAPFDQRAVSVQAQYGQLYGSLTRGGKPLEKAATLEPGGGVGFAAASSGEYRAATLDPVMVDARIEVMSCDGAMKAVFIADRPSSGRGRYDIDIPDNALKVQVIDTFTSMALPGAAVAAAVLSERDGMPVYTARRKTGGDGAAEFESLPLRTIRLTASLAGYEKAQAPPFEMPRSGEKIVEIQLVPVRGGGGRILSPKPFEAARLYWCSANSVVESAEVGVDGAFSFAREHAADEVMILVSESHPFWVRRGPAADPAASLELPFPSAPSRTFFVNVLARIAVLNQHIGLTIGGIDVPYAQLHEHLALRNAKVRHFPDILETAAIEVVLDQRQGSAAPRKKLERDVSEVVFR